MVIPSMRAPIAALALAAALCAPSFARTARAQDKSEAEAQRLFLEGRAAVERGDYAAGCPKFEESLKIVRRAGTLLNLAQCEDHAGRLRPALDYWNEGAKQLDPTDERLALARKRIAELEARVPKLTVSLASTAPAGVVVRVDGAPLPAAEIGAARQMDPGSHEVVLLVPGQPEQRLPVELAEGDRKEVLLQVAPGERSVMLVPGKGGPSGGDDGRRTLGLVLGGVGVAGLVAAGVTGGMIMARDGDIDAACPDQRCTPQGRELIRGSTPLLVVNGIAWGVGLVGLGAGAWLFFTSGDKGAPATALDAAPLPGGAWVSMRRSF